MDGKYKYTYEKNANYCYKGTDILINLLNIKMKKIYLMQKENLYH